MINSRRKKALFLLGYLALLPNFEEYTFNCSAAGRDYD
jgi:hypothetical protein